MNRASALPGTDDGVVVQEVRRPSPAAAAGIGSGDRLVSINGTGIRDVIDFYFLIGEEQVEIELERGGELLSVRVERPGGRSLGLTLAPPRPAEIQRCANKCIFCFIHQLPRGMRKSLYVKDDDYRLSFLHGNYITLTDLSETEIQRIIDQHLSPLYISVHATDPDLRHFLLGEPRLKGDLLGRMSRLAGAGITMHAQIVLCPDINDGSHLERSVWDLAALHPQVATVAVVPVGLTRFRERLYPLRSVTTDEAAFLLKTIHGWQATARERLGSRFVFPADELYLLAGETIPQGRDYEGFPIVEDGVGLVRRFLDGFPSAVRRLPKRVTPPRRVTIVTGTLFSPILQRHLDTLSVDGLEVCLASVPNDFFGHGITVAGLLTGQDILKHLSQRELGDLVIIPNVTLRDGDGVFLDDLTPRDLQDRLGVPIKMVDPAPRGLCQALFG
jgi:putative radical SAM enzyme (TIGR03279 family)